MSYTDFSKAFFELKLLINWKPTRQTKYVYMLLSLRRGAVSHQDSWPPALNSALFHAFSGCQEEQRNHWGEGLQWQKVGGLIKHCWQTGSAEGSELLDKLLVFKVMIASTQGQGHVWSMKDVSHMYRMRETVMRAWENPGKCCLPKWGGS